MTRLWHDGEAVVTWEEDGRVAGFVWQGQAQHITQVCNRWRVHTGWWEPQRALWREYLKVATEEGLLCLLYHDLLSGGWFFARLYD